MRSRGTRDPTDAARRERGIRTRRSASLPDERLWNNDRRISKGSWRNEGGNAIKNVGEYTGPLSALSRSKIEKAANNEMRTELLKALGTAFGVKGMTVQDGKARFTRDFLQRLERIIGADFKRDDFALDAEGYVVSGRPLTARRIKAIISKAYESAVAMLESLSGGG